MAGMFNSFYYGKAGKADFTPDQLPANRVDLFFQTLRVRFSGLIGINLLYILCQLPSLVWTVINLMVLNQLVETGQATQLTAYVQVYLLIMIPCMAFSGAFKPGIIYVIRNWSRDQHSFVMSDFKDAVKDNWKQGALVGLINGLSLLLTYVCVLFYSDMAVAGSVFWVVPQVFVIILCAAWWMANMLIFPMMVTYKMQLKQVIRNCFIITLARLPWSVLVFGLTIGIPALIVYYVPYGMLAGIVIYLLIGYALSFFIFTSYANSCFDRFLNPRIEGAPVNLGLRDPDYVDEDDEDDAPGDAT